MDDRDKLQQQMLEIGNRYLSRTLGELASLHDLMDKVRGGLDSERAACLKDIERMAHKIYGSGAMFGFDEVSERAREVELLAAGGTQQAEFIRRLESGVAALDEQVRAAARARGLA
ncbi:MAG: Hpt domain-containing protein [Burkholderiaceae bacterium]